MKTGHLNRFNCCCALVCILGLMLAGCGSRLASVPTSVPTTFSTAVATAAPTAAPATPQATGEYWPTAGWRTSTPEQQGMDGKSLDAMDAEIRERHMKVHSFLVVRHGYLVHEAYFGSYGPGDRQEGQSVVKSFIGTLVGIALDKGYIKGLDERVVDYFPEKTIQNLDERKKAMTVEDLLTMRSGLDYTDTAFFGVANSKGDWVQVMLDLPMATDPGTEWLYCTGCSYLLSAIVQKASGMKTFDFATQYVLDSMGITDFRWSGATDGDPAGAWGMHLRPRDMAKLGYLNLRKGQWDGQQIVSAKWVETATQTHTTQGADPHFAYGYHWFTQPAMEGFAALGTGGQIILVIPKSDLVIVTTANTEESIFELFEKYVLPAVKD